MGGLGRDSKFKIMAIGIKIRLFEIPSMNPISRSLRRQNVPMKTTDWKIGIIGKRNDLPLTDEDLQKRDYVPRILLRRWIYKRIRMM